MKKLITRVVLGVVVGVAVYVSMSVWADARRVADALATFRWSAAALGILLAAGNYLLRFVRWHYYLRILGLAVPAGESLLVFLAGFSLTVTPGKLGEAVKALLLRQSRGIAASRTAPIVLSERATDLLGLLVLAGIGAAQLDVRLRQFLLLGMFLVVAALVIVSVEPLAEAALRTVARLPGLARFEAKLRAAHASTAATLRPWPLVVALGLSTAAWFLECVAFWVIVAGFDGASIALYDATWIYAAMTVAGALSFLPGGLGVSEAVLLALLARYGTGTGPAVAAAATFVTRVSTLWFAVAVGLVALVAFARRAHVSIAELPVDANPTS